jgi:type IV pilus assembly protein PilM
MAKKITTLYISDTGIHLLVTRGKRIIKLADAPLDMNLSDITAQVKEAEITARIRNLFRSNKIREKKVIIGLSGLHCLSRPAVLPQLPRAMLDEAVLREARRVLPVPIEQLYISWQITSSTEGKIEIFLVAVPRQIADTVIEVLRQLGLKPYLMDIKPLALARLVKEATAIIVDVQPREFDIVIMVNGIPQPIRTVPFPQEASSSDRLATVKDELRRTVQFYNNNNPENPIQPGELLYVSGELASDTESYESLASELGYRVLPLSSPLKCAKQLDPTHYLVNIGLALKELGKEAGPLLPNFNILPVPYQPKPLPKGKLLAIPAAAIAIGLVIMVAMTIQNAAADIDSAHSQLDNTNSILEQRQSQKKSLTDSIAALQSNLASSEAARNTFTAAFDSFSQRGEVINGDLTASVANLAGATILRSIQHSSSRMELVGQAASEAEVLTYARNLRATGRFSEVTVASMRRVEGSDSVIGGMEFSLFLKLKGAE